MSKRNGKVIDLDLSDLVEPIHLKIGEYECILTPDLPLPLMVKIARSFSNIGESIQSTEDTDLSALQDDLWSLTGEVLARAVPPPPSPVQEMLTTQAAFKLLSFLASTFSRAMGVETAEPS